MTAFLTFLFCFFIAVGVALGWTWRGWREDAITDAVIDDQMASAPADPRMAQRVSVLRLRKREWLAAEKRTKDAYEAFVVRPNEDTRQAWVEANACAQECWQAKRQCEKWLMEAAP